MNATELMERLERDANAELLKAFGDTKRAGVGFVSTEVLENDVPVFTVCCRIDRKAWSGDTRVRWALDGRRIARADLAKRLEAGR